MDIKIISSFITVADVGSFSKAATIIGINQPAIGKQIRRLEQECGSQLFHRNGRGVILTPEGVQLLDKLRPLISDIDSVILNNRGSSGCPAGEISVALTPTVMRMAGYEIYRQATKDFPRIKLNIVTGYSGYIYEWLMSARVDIAVLHDSRRAKHVLATSLAKLPLSLISAVRGVSGAAPDTPVAFNDIGNVPLVLATWNHGLRRSVEAAADAVGIKLNVAHEVDSFDLMKEIAMRGDAHTILARHAVQQEIDAGLLLARDIANPPIYTHLMMATASNRPRTRAVKAMEDVIVGILQA